MTAERELEQSRIRWVRRSGDAAAVAARLAERGAVPVRTERGSVTVRNVARTCLEPIGFEWESRRGVGNSIVARLVVRCRACADCRLRRRREWIARAIRETGHAWALGKRNWFVTLTLAPQWRQLATHLSMVPKVPWDRPEPEEKARKRVIAGWVTLYLKRLRETAGAQFRYLAALETHEDGEFHIHLLVHEYLGEVHERMFRAAWRPAGIAKAKLVNGASAARRVAFYVAKYATKEDGFDRQRASLHYGHGGLPMQAEAANAVSTHSPEGA